MNDGFDNLRRPIQSSRKPLRVGPRIDEADLNEIVVDQLVRPHRLGIRHHIGRVLGRDPVSHGLHDVARIAPLPDGVGEELGHWLLPLRLAHGLDDVRETEEVAALSRLDKLREPSNSSFQCSQASPSPPAISYVPSLVVADQHVCIFAAHVHLNPIDRHALPALLLHILLSAAVACRQGGCCCYCCCFWCKYFFRCCYR